MKILLLLLGFALANAATTITQNNDQAQSITIHRNTPEKYPTEFELGKTHRFNYTGDVRTSFPQTGNETVGQRIQCIVEIVPLTTTIWNMRLVKPTLFEINGTHDKPQTMINSTMITEELKTLLQYNVTFQISQGTIHIIYANATEPEWIVNIKKGILNMITLKMEKDNVYETEEEGVSGICKTMYSIQETKNEDLVKILNVTKVRDLTNCTKTAFNKVNNFKFQTCDTCTKNKKSMEATATFKYNITGTKQRFIINGVQSDARYVFFPMGVKGGSVFVHVNQTLHLINVTEEPLFTKSPEQVPRGTLIYTFPQLVNVEETMLNTIEKVVFLLEKLKEHHSKPFTVDSPSHFIMLVKTLSEADYHTLQNIWQLVMVEPVQRKWLIEALPYVNQEDMTLLIKELITTEETLLTTEEKITLLTKLGTIRQPTEKTVEYLKETCEHPFLQWPHNKKVNTTYIYKLVTIRHTCWRSLGIQINALKKQHKYISPTFVHTLTKCEDTFDKLTKLTPWDPVVYKNKMNIANQIAKTTDNTLSLPEAKALLNTTLVTKVREMCLVAIGQAGLPDHIPVIEPILHQTFTNQTLDVRIAATIALRRMNTSPYKVLSLLLPVFRNPYEDAELRCTAYLNIVRTNQRPSVFAMIGQEANRDKCQQVRSFVHSHLTMLTEDVEPCNRDKAIAARYALIYMRPVNLGPTYSKIRTVRTFDQESEMGTKMTTETMFSEGELTPSRTTVRMEVDMFGKKTPLFTVGFKTSGLTNMMDKMFGYDGHFYKRKSIFNLLKERTRRSANTNEEEITTINQKLNPYEVTPEEPRFKAYIDMFGNRITELDVNKDYLMTLIKEGKFTTDFTNLDEELAKKQTFNVTKGLMLMDYKMEHPTIMGLPLSYNTTIGSILRMKVNTTMKALPSLLTTQTSFAALVNVTPEMVVNAVFKMGVHTPLIKFGSAVNATINTTLPIQTGISIEFAKKHYTLMVPQIEKNLTLLNVTHKVYNFWQKKDMVENFTVVNTTLTNRKPLKTIKCFSPFNDTSVCFNMTYVPRLGQPKSPFQPLTGPSHFAIFSNRTMWAPKTVRMEYKVVSTDETWPTQKNIDILLTTTGVRPDQVEYQNITTLKFRYTVSNKTVQVEMVDNTNPQWRTVIQAVNLEGEIDVNCTWGLPKEYTTKVNNTKMNHHREFYLRVNSPRWTWNDTRNVTFFWAELPTWFTNVTKVTQNYLMKPLLETMKKTTETDFMIEPVQNPMVNSTTVSMKMKTNHTVDVNIITPIQKFTLVNVTVPFNTTVVNKNLPHALETVKREFTEKYLAGNCTYNHTGFFKTYDKMPFHYNLTGSCPHVLTKDCSPDKRFTVLVQNTRLPNNKIKTTPYVTIYIDTTKIELLTTTNGQIKAKYNGQEKMTYTNSPMTEEEVGTMERNTTHITLKADIGLTVVYSKYNVTTYLSPWYVNKTCGLCGDFNGETFYEMKNTDREEITNTTKFGASWLVQGDDCKDSMCKLTKEELYSLPQTVYLANKPAVCFSKEPLKLCPIGCNNMTPENIYESGTLIPTKHFVRVPFFCMASENVEETKNKMKSRSELIKLQPTDLYRDIEVPHDCDCVQNCKKTV